MAESEKKARIAFRCEPELKEKAEDEAKKRNLSLSDYCRSRIADGDQLDRIEEKIDKVSKTK